MWFSSEEWTETLLKYDYSKFREIQTKCNLLAHSIPFRKCVSLTLFSASNPKETIALETLKKMLKCNT